ncbi:MAG: chromosome condensation regulator, partial [Sphaerochaetaceae bacterium]|nr:chromosome condensation regulator [Sphaerochaetaceae bacterium]
TTGEHVSLFVGLDGSLWSAGLNNQGQLGDGTNTSSTTFVTILDNVKVIDAGIEHAIAVTKDGRLWGWGSNAFGQFGDGSFNMKTNKPTEIKIIY